MKKNILKLLLVATILTTLTLGIHTIKPMIDPPSGFIMTSIFG